MPIFFVLKLNLVNLKVLLFKIYKRETEKFNQEAQKLIITINNIIEIINFL